MGWWKSCRKPGLSLKSLRGGVWVETQKLEIEVSKDTASQIPPAASAALGFDLLGCLQHHLLLAGLLEGLPDVAPLLFASVLEGVPHAAPLQALEVL